MNKRGETLREALIRHTAERYIFRKKAFRGMDQEQKEGYLELMSIGWNWHYKPDSSKPKCPR